MQFHDIFSGRIEARPSAGVALEFASPDSVRIRDAIL
jgi:hypothetical protein